MLTNPDTAAMASIRACLADTTHDLQSAQALLDAGRSVDLSGMDRRIGMLCRQTLALPPPVARETLADLETLRRSMDLLIETLERRPIR